MPSYNDSPTSSSGYVLTLLSSLIPLSAPMSSGPFPHYDMLQNISLANVPHGQPSSSRSPSNTPSFRMSHPGMLQNLAAHEARLGQQAQPSRSLFAGITNASMDGQLFNRDRVPSKSMRSQPLAPAGTPTGNPLAGVPNESLDRDLVNRHRFAPLSRTSKL
ncbi:hypothetical protein JCM11641_003699 [Rhodosporidiobolus odoratus]